MTKTASQLGNEVLLKLAYGAYPQQEEEKSIARPIGGALAGAALGGLAGGGASMYSSHKNAPGAFQHARAYMENKKKIHEAKGQLGKGLSPEEIKMKPSLVRTKRTAGVPTAELLSKQYPRQERAYQALKGRTMKGVGRGAGIGGILGLGAGLYSMLS